MLELPMQHTHTVYTRTPTYTHTRTHTRMHAATMNQAQFLALSCSSGQGGSLLSAESVFSCRKADDTQHQNTSYKAC